MTAGQPPPLDRSARRRRAERRLSGPADAQAPSESDTARLLHELQVRQVELELQNEELVESRARLEASLAELAASESRYQDTFEQAAVGIAHVAPDGRWLRVNRKLCDIVGYSAAELRGMTYKDITHPDDLGADLHLAQRMLAGDIGSCALEKRYLRSDGRAVWIELTVSLVRDAADAPGHFIAVVVDINARRTAEAELDRFFNLSLDLLCVADFDNRLLRVNPAFTRCLGWSAAELTDGRDLTEFIHPDDRQATLRARADVHAGQELRELENRYRCRDGSYRWLAWSTYPSLDTRQIFAVARDVTERRQRDGQLRLLEACITRLNDAVLITEATAIDEPGPKIVYANPAFERMTGYALAELVGRSPRLLQGRQTERAALDRIRAALQARQSVRTELANHDREGSAYWIEIDIAPVLADNGTVTHFVAVQRDVTVRKRVEAALREGEARYRQLFDANPQPMWIYDPLTLRFLAVNDAAVVRYGWRREEFLAMTLEDIRPAEGLPALQLAMANVRAGLPPLALRYRHRLKDGRLVDVELNAQPIEFDGHMARAVQVQDVTVRRHAAQLVLESRESLRALLQRLQRAQEDERVRVAREVHDELGQMLTGLKMDLRWIERRLAEPGLGAKRQPLLDRAVAASALNEETIAAVQKLAAELRPAALDQLGLGAALAQRARQFQQRTGVTCTVAGADDLPPLPAAVATELFYIAQEALTNVARHAQARNVAIRLRVQDAAVQMEVDDDGVGITPAALAAPRSLGLLGMRERALQSGGTVQIDVAQPHGTRVLVRVPLAGPPP
ncbi:MAG: PAS domain S-box protein [Rhodoferax sp.]|nr:PAS domain S-box protein [Rhodoferax sp.]